MAPDGAAGIWASIRTMGLLGLMGRIGFQVLDFLGDGLADFEPAGVWDEPAVACGGEWFIRLEAADCFVCGDDFVVGTAG